MRLSEFACSVAMLVGMACGARAGLPAAPVEQWRYVFSEHFPPPTPVMDTNPIVVQLTDDDGDGAVTPLDSPDVVFHRVSRRFDERNDVMREDRHLFFYPGRAVGTLDDGLLEPGDGRVTTLHQRDRLRRPILITDPDGRQTRLDYDGMSRIIRSTDPIGSRTETTWDALGQPVSAQRVERSVLSGIEESFLSTSAYDALGRLALSIAPNGQRTSWQHDSRGNAVRRTDALANEVEYRHDRLGRLVDQRTYLSATGTYGNASTADASQGGGDGVIHLRASWDSHGRIRTRSDDRGNVTTYTHDPLGHLTRIDYGDGTNERREYSLDGELRRVTRQDGSVLSWDSDAEGRPTRVATFPTVFGGSPTLTTWTHDGLGRLIQDSHDNGPLEDVTHDYHYDSLSRRILERQIISGWDDPREVRAEHAGANRRVRLTLPTGRVIHSVHDPLGRVARLHETSGADIARFDWIGSRLLRQSLGSGLVMDRRDPVTGSSITGTNAGFDANGRPIRATWRTPTGQDVAQWLSTWNGPGGVGTDRRIAEQQIVLLGTMQSRSSSWELDSAYRQVSFNRDGSPGARVLDGANKALQFFEDGIAHLMEVDAVPSEAGLNQYSAIDAVPRTYSETGALTDDGPLRYGWDARDRLVRVQTSTGALRTEYVRSADGRVVLSRGASPTTRHVFWGWQEVAEFDADDDPLREYVHGPGIDQHVQMRNVVDGAVFYSHLTDIGSVGILTDGLGSTVEMYDYSWLGRPRVIDAGNVGIQLDRSPRGNPFLFQGVRWDPDAGLHDFRNRYYDPQWGEFLSIDPLGPWGHGIGNGYEAFLGNAASHVDPSGLYPLFGGPFGLQVGAETPAGIVDGFKDGASASWDFAKAVGSEVASAAAHPVATARALRDGAPYVQLAATGAWENKGTIARELGEQALWASLEASFDSSGYTTGYYGGHGLFMVVEGAVLSKGAGVVASGGARVGGVCRTFTRGAPGAAAPAGSAAARGEVLRGTAQAVEGGLVRPGGTLEGVLRGIEDGFRAAPPGSQDDALRLIQQATGRVGLEPGVARITDAGETVLSNVGGITTTVRQSGEILVQRGGDVLLHLRPGS